MSKTESKTTPSILAKETVEKIFYYDDRIPASPNSMAYDYACIIQEALDEQAKRTASFIRDTQ